MKEFQLDVFRQFTRMFPKQKPTKLKNMLDFTRNSQDQVKSDGPSVTSIDQTYTSLEKKYVSFFWPKQAQVSLMESVLGRKLPYILLWLFISM